MRGSVASYPIFPTPKALLAQPLPITLRGRSAQAWTVDGLWVLFLIGACSAARPLGVENIERYFWLAADLAVLAFLIRDYRPFLTAALENKLIMTWPALAIISALWSYNPAISLYHGFQLLMTTMVGFQFFMQVDRTRIPKLLFVGLLVCLLSSLAFRVLDPRSAFDLNGVFMGVFTHKNVLGSMMTLLIFTSACLFLSHWRPILVVATATTATLVLTMSKSGTAMIIAVLTLLPIALAFCLRRGARTMAFAIGVVLLAAVAAFFVISFMQIDVAGMVLSSVGKDSTLTGRTVLWGFGIDAFMENPWLGLGYKAYWESTQTTMFYLRYVIGQDLWFFHNNYIEVAVAFGVMGPALMIAGIVQGFSRTLRVFMRDHSYISLWYVLFMVAVTIDAVVEYPLFLNHGLFQFLFVAVTASSAKVLTVARRTAAALPAGGAQ